jgi:hypothetical protein
MKFLVLFLTLIMLAGCSTFRKKVAPFQREILAKSGMNFIENPEEEASMQHMFNAREGSMGGFGGAGGGCGCN